MNIIEISSPQNPRYKAWLKLLDARGIKKQELALLSGRSFIDEIFAHHAGWVTGVIVRKQEELSSYAVREDCPVYLVPNELFQALDIYGIKGPIAIISAPPLQVWDRKFHADVTVFLPFQNPINLGTTIRTAAAFGAHVVLLQEAATPYLPKSLRASGPAIFQIPVYQGPSLEELATYEDLPLFALSPRGESIYDTTFAKPVGLVAGMEGPGLDAFWPAKKRLSIPMHSCVESLNASIAMGIVMAFACQP